MKNKKKQKAHSSATVLLYVENKVECRALFTLLYKLRIRYGRCIGIKSDPHSYHTPVFTLLRGGVAIRIHGGHKTHVAP